jgi:hypothetical protein
VKTSVEQFDAVPGIGIAIEIDGTRHAIVIYDDNDPAYVAELLRAFADRIAVSASVSEP